MTDALPGTAVRKVRIVAEVAVFWCGYLTILFLISSVKTLVPERWGQLAWGLASSAALLPLSLVFLRRAKLSPRAAGLVPGPGSFPRLLAGISMGLAVYGINILAVALIAGPIHFARASDVNPGPIALTICTILALAGMEELGFRGYSLRILNSSLGYWPAQAIVALAFGLSHIAFGWSWANVLLGLIPSALVFGIAAIASGGLALPIGIHAGLNLARFFVGADDDSGVWRIVVPEAARDRIAALAPFIGVAITLLAAFGLWRWGQFCSNRRRSMGAE